MDDTLNKKEREILEKIEETKKRFPYHSVQPYLIQELEELEEQLEEIRKKKRAEG
ncbi:MAG: histidine kinase [Clostridiales bacterium]|nr:histidine kinase [Eubacteriales bacterium]MDH7566351.1 histidine kinase [Clostridiales bacterium]